MTLALSGHAVVGGIAIGQTHIIQENELNIQEYGINPEGVEPEILRLETALQNARQHLRELADKVRQSAGEAAEEIIATHITMLDDSTLRETA